MTDAPDPLDLEIARRLKATRITQGMTQTELGQAIGVTFQQVQKYERGSNRVSASTLMKCAVALDTSIAALCGEDDIAPESLPMIRAYSLLRDDQRRALLAVVRAMGSDA
jgi:transcriptional regulator with XRE-family HTH domain